VSGHKNRSSKLGFNVFVAFGPKVIERTVQCLRLAIELTVIIICSNLTKYLASFHLKIIFIWNNNCKLLVDPIIRTKQDALYISDEMSV
jgi:hypothetical protein